MKFRKTTKADAEKVMRIIGQAQAYLKSQGIDQWQNNYPNMETVLRDIEEQKGYVLTMNGDIVGTVTISFDGELTYDVIYDGAWRSDFAYAVVHRIAIMDCFKGRGYASLMLEGVVAMCMARGIHSIRIDTHVDNISMQSLIRKNGFQYCGIIHLADNSKRLAYEKLISY